MKYFIFFFLLVLPARLKAQESALGADTKADTSVIEHAPEILPGFAGGDRSLYQYLSSHLRYPSDAVRDEISGKVMVRFTVCADGQLCDYEVLESPAESLSQESLRVIRNMPRWTPAQKDGEAVKAIYTLPVIFKLQ